MKSDAHAKRVGARWLKRERRWGRPPTLALALGGGGSRGLAHIVVFEALDELGVKPVAIAGTSVGAAMGAAYAAGLSGKDIRRDVIALAHDRAEVIRRMLAARASGFAGFASGFANPMLADAEKLVRQFLPAEIPEDFSELAIPLSVVATDLYGRCEAVIEQGPLRQAIAASMAVPGLVRPMNIDGRILVDGGAINPLPFEHVRGKADLVLAVDIAAAPAGPRRGVPDPFETLFATMQVMGFAIISEKLRHFTPDIIVRPNVGSFRLLDFFQASAILRAAEPAKAFVKERLAELID